MDTEDIDDAYEIAIHTSITSDHKLHLPHTFSRHANNTDEQHCIIT